MASMVHQECQLTTPINYRTLGHVYLLARSIVSIADLAILSATAGVIWKPLRCLTSVRRAADGRCLVGQRVLGEDRAVRYEMGCLLSARKD